MERLRDISRFWSWLPAFRAVGETSHLPSAAAGLNLSPSALSRSIKQLERSLGCDLFRRSNRRLELTPEGDHLLVVLRDAMRAVHQASLMMRDGRHRGVLRVGSEGVATSAWVLPAILEVHEEHPELAPELSTELGDLVPRLLSGRLDIVFLSRLITHAQLRTVELGAARAGVFCGPTHPLYSKEEVTLDEVLESDFVAPPPDDAGASTDGWPQTIARRVVLRMDRMRLGCEACLAKPLLIVLPDFTAEKLGLGNLRRLPLEVVPPATVYATLRLTIRDGTAADVLMDVVRERIARPSAPPH